MGRYTINQHIDNIDTIEKLISLFKVQKEQEKFEIINLLADFLSNNEQYCDLISYSKLASSLVDIIEYCNNIEYSIKQFNTKFEKIYYDLSNILVEIKQVYKINVYFKGRDKYKLFHKIISSNVNLSEKGVDRDSGKEFKVLIVSEETCNEVLTKNYDLLINYDKYMNDCFNLLEQVYQYNYDYDYLLNNIKRAQNSYIDGIIVGMSYSRNGVDVNSLNGNYINLSLSSQDIYYSYKIAKEIIDKNKKIKKCILGTGYYSFYLDMSKSLNDGIPRIQSVYYPIFKDSHNYNYTNKVSPKNFKEYINKNTKYIFNIDELQKQLSKLLNYNYKSYFNNSKTRESISLLNGRSLSSFSTEDKLRLAKERAEMHNKLRKNTITKEENIEILEEFLQYLKTKNIQPIIVNFNNTEYYNRFINNEYIIEYTQIIDKVRSKYEGIYVDLNNYNNMFEEKDFVDFDHLSYSGARKASRIISKF